MLRPSRLVRLSAARVALRDLNECAPSIDEVAKAAAMSRFYFIRQFKAVFGVTPIEYRTRARIDQAKYLLKYSDQSVTEICMSVGFSSLGSFSSLFAARVGQSPSAYRRVKQASTAPDAPTCMQLMQAAWMHESQKTRSAAATGSATLRGKQTQGEQQ